MSQLQKYWQWPDGTWWLLLFKISVHVYTLWPPFEEDSLFSQKNRKCDAATFYHHKYAIVKLYYQKKHVNWLFLPGVQRINNKSYKAKRHMRSALMSSFKIYSLSKIMALNLFDIEKFSLSAIYSIIWSMVTALHWCGTFTGTKPVFCFPYNIIIICWSIIKCTALTKSSSRVSFKML